MGKKWKLPPEWSLGSKVRGVKARDQGAEVVLEGVGVL